MAFCSVNETKFRHKVGRYYAAMREGCSTIRIKATPDQWGELAAKLAELGNLDVTVESTTNADKDDLINRLIIAVDDFATP
jgi:hypothetical protein